jgi:hypothetical protein
MNDITSSVGICAISPDAVEAHSGACAQSGCMCCGNPCTPAFTAATGGTAPGVFFLGTFRSTQ